MKLSERVAAMRWAFSTEDGRTEDLRRLATEVADMEQALAGMPCQMVLRNAHVADDAACTLKYGHDGPCRWRPKEGA